MNKKNECRFTIAFCPVDARQRRVVDILNNKGRKKAAYLTAAILHYEECNRDVELAPDQDAALQRKIEQAVKKALDDTGYQGKQTELCSDSSANKVPRKKTTKVTPDTDVSEQDRNKIADALKAFRK